MSSPFQTLPLTYLISLPPSALSNIPLNLTLNLNKSLLTYDKRLKGILCSYSDMSFKDNKPFGKIINENPWLNFKVQFNGLIFSPHPGIILKGEINKISSGHIGILIYNVFNASVMSENLKEWSYNEDGECWEKGGESMEVGGEVEFKVEGEREEEGVVSFFGSVE
ncbi:hypothetical protein TrLO_g12360 [Triparma laevis f. longispina]|uniref:RPA43 OB domain-containing protein n=1 Tax=Triparma laevis f. longispina TaxID=1714387 RepID=A0A9W7FU96_9STRA|nr:hypothetical protein TrLO_g12360 [Triparma laevis f. longispina]